MHAVAKGLYTPGGFSFFDSYQTYFSGKKKMRITFDRKYLFIGGLLSGFFGGFSGHQGALRAAFLAKVGITPQAFVGTNAAIGFMVDAARIATYAFLFFAAGTSYPVDSGQWPLIVAAIVFAFAGGAPGQVISAQGDPVNRADPDRCPFDRHCPTTGVWDSVIIHWQFQGP